MEKRSCSFLPKYNQTKVMSFFSCLWLTVSEFLCIYYDFTGYLMFICFLTSMEGSVLTFSIFGYICSGGSNIFCLVTKPLPSPFWIAIRTVWTILLKITALAIADKRTASERMTSDGFIFSLELLNIFHASPNNSDFIYKNNRKACHVLSKVHELFIILMDSLMKEH